MHFTGGLFAVSHRHRMVGTTQAHARNVHGRGTQRREYVRSWSQRKQRQREIRKTSCSDALVPEYIGIGGGKKMCSTARVCVHRCIKTLALALHASWSTCAGSGRLQGMGENTPILHLQGLLCAQHTDVEHDNHRWLLRTPRRPTGALYGRAVCRLSKPSETASCRPPPSASSRICALCGRVPFAGSPEV